jgi:hypothetical protein
MARTSVNDLRWAKVATLGSLVAFVAAAAVTWIAPSRPATAYTKVTYRQGGATTTTVCGESAESTPSAITIKLAPSGEQKIPLSDVVSIDAVKSCG